MDNGPTTTRASTTDTSPIPAAPTRHPREAITHHHGFRILARWEVSDPACLPTVPFIVVSVQDPDADEVEVSPSPYCRGILRLAFDDVDSNYPGDSVVRMNAQHARRIWTFVQEHFANVACIVCQCEAGISRSAGIAVGLSEAMGMDSAWIFASPAHAPNRCVAGLVREAAKGTA